MFSFVVMEQRSSIKIYFRLGTQLQKRTKRLKPFMETKLHFISVYASVLKDSERGERTSKVDHGLGGCQLLKVREQLRSSCIDSQTRSNDP